MKLYNLLKNVTEYNKDQLYIYGYINIGFLFFKSSIFKLDRI